MAELLQIALLPLTLTVLAYQFGLWVQKKLHSPLFNPILVAVAVILTFFALTGMKNTDYQAGMSNISWLLTPATISLAIPLYQHFSTLKKDLPAILAGITAGAIVSLLFVLGWSLLFQYDRALMMSLLPKSVTSAIGVPLTEMGGGVSALTTAVIIITGILGSLMGPLLCKLLRIKSPIAQGVAFGTAAHVIGTARANELHPLTGAVSSLSLATAGLVTAIVFPILLQFL